MSMSVTIGETGHSLSSILLAPGVIAAFIAATVTMIGFLIASRDVRKAAKRFKQESDWRMADLMNSWWSRIHSDPNVGVIMRVLDWREGPVVIPDEFKPIFAKQSLPTDILEIDWERFVDALVVHRTGDEWRAADLYMYRTCFDAYCSMLQTITHDQRLKEMNYAQVCDLQYFCERTVEPLNAAKLIDPRAGEMIRSYIKAYYRESTYDQIADLAEIQAQTDAQGNEMLEETPIFPDDPDRPETRWGRLKQRFGLD